MEPAPLDVYDISPQSLPAFDLDQLGTRLYALGHKPTCLPFDEHFAPRSQCRAIFLSNATIAYTPSANRRCGARYVGQDRGGVRCADFCRPPFARRTRGLGIGPKRSSFG